MVKCTSCNARWRAFQDRSEAQAEPPEDDLLVEGPPPAPLDDDLEFVAAPVTPVRKPKTKRSPALVVGVSLVAVLAVAAGAAVVLRQQIAELAPATAPMFAAIGLPVNTLGLVIEQVKSKPGFQAGRPVLSVTGVIRNVRKASIEAPPIRVSLLDKQGKTVAGMLAQPLNGRVPPGAIRYFALALPDPPAGATELEVGFDLAAKPQAVVAESHPVPLAAAEPSEAQPLPASSPDALQPPGAAKHE